MVIFVTGPSGVGKSFLTQTYYTKSNIPMLLSVNTRPLRPTEKEKNRTISIQEFERLHRQTKLCLVSKNHGHFYGYLIDDLAKRSSNTLIEVDSATAIREKTNFNAKIIRIIPASSHIDRILLNIKNKRDQVEWRLSKYYDEMEARFLEARKLQGDILFENGFDLESVNNFIALIKTVK